MKKASKRMGAKRLATANAALVALLAARDGLRSGLFSQEQVYAAVLSGVHMAELVIADASGATTWRRP